MAISIYTLNFLLLASCLLDMRSKNAEQRFSYGLIRTFILVPLLVLEYLYLSTSMRIDIVGPLFFSENIFALTWLLIVYNLRYVMNPAARVILPYRIAPVIIFTAGLICGIFWIISPVTFKIADNNLILAYYGKLFFSSLFLLTAVLLMAWRLESFLRNLDPKMRQPYKYMAVGFFLMIGCLACSASYRLTYFKISVDHLLLLAILLTVAWVLVVYALVANRLLNRKIFISRKVVYSTVAPLFFACYLIGVGLISLAMKTFGWPLHFVLEWLLVISGVLVISVIAISERVRSRIKYFISTNFYVNKYEYRDEWLAFSSLLHKSFTEKGVVDALRKILKESLYTDTIKIWIKDKTQEGFLLVDPEQDLNNISDNFIAGDDPLIYCLAETLSIDCRTLDSDTGQDPVLIKKADFFKSLNLELIVPLSIGDHFLGMIGLGAEYTGGRYGRDDFDLLTALGSQAAAALIAVWTAEELAQAREQSAWNTLSTFVLHDIKNAANMLSLVMANASDHIDNPEFQQDMLMAIDDSLKRMDKVQTRLNTFKGEISPVMQTVNASSLLWACCRRLGKKLPNLTVETHVTLPKDYCINTDPDFISIILENLCACVCVFV